MAGDDDAVPTPKIDSQSPYYLGSNAGPEAKISNVVLRRHNYDDWKNSMRMSLKSHRKFGFIDGTIKKPTDPVLLENWEVVHCTLVQWIHNTIDESLLETISYVEDASVLWNDLAAQFSVVDGTVIYNMKTQLKNCVQTKGMDVTTYYGKLKSLWDSLVVHEPPFACKCGDCKCNIGPDAIKRLDNERLHQFFMGLDPTLYGPRAWGDKVLFCQYCDTRGHEVSTCYIKSQRFPEWWGDRPRTLKELRRAQAARRNRGSTSGPSSSAGPTSGAPGSGKEQVVKANMDRSLKTTIGSGELRDGLCWIRACAPSTGIHQVSALGPRDLWHRHLGHPSDQVVKTISFASKFNFNKDWFCDVCHLSKQHRHSFRNNEQRALNIFDLVHCDLWGPYRIPSSCGAKYFLTIVDDFSRATWVYLLLDKTEVTDMFMNFINMVSTQLSKTLKVVQSDNGTEFNRLAGYFFAHGIKFQKSCVGTPQQNGRVERKHRHILNVARSLLFQANLNKSFWGESILTAVFLINRTSSPLIDNKTPYECLYGLSPSYANLRVFGCLAFAHNQNARGDNFEKRGRKCIFVGYPSDKKGWKLFDLETESYFISRDVIFHETSFPFATPVSDSVHSPSSPNPNEPFNGTGEGAAETAATGETPDVGSGATATGPATAIDAAETATTDTEETAETAATDATDAAAPVSGSANSGNSENRPGTAANNSAGSEGNVGYVLGTTRNPSPSSSSSNPSTSSSGTPYDLAHYINCNIFSEKQRHFIAAITSGIEPPSFKEAIKDDGWCTAMKAEIEALERNEMWELTDLPKDKKALGC
ncbi:uncharacterized protein LOC141630814 [Silene latifolia]|uniref:uncharacterized protein LOC141630814 n=1 Tax=Silene latifolia TaxID=37657 RepID=UPI003D77A9F6